MINPQNGNDYIKIRNWDKWQTYRKDRGQPPWIKIHRCVMRNPEWVSLTDAERGQLIAIWLLAADHHGVIPASPDMIKKLCFLDTKPNLEKFIKLQFLIRDDANMTPECRQDDANMTNQKQRQRQRQRQRQIQNTRARARGHKWPSNFCLTDEKKEYAIKNGIDPKKVELFWKDFKNWAESKEAKYKDWNAAFRTRVGKAPEYGKQFMKKQNEWEDL